MAQMPAPMTIAPTVSRFRLRCERLAIASAKPDVTIAIASETTVLTMP